MKKLYLLILAFFIFPTLTFSQAPQKESLDQVEAQENQVGPEEAAIRPVISGGDLVRVNKNIILDASSTVFKEVAEASYRWEMGDGTILEGEEVVHTYKESGRFTINLTVAQGEQVMTISKEIVAYNKLIFLITDATQWKENIKNLKKDAELEGTYLFVLESYDSNSPFVSEENLYNKLNDQLPLLLNADGIVVWTNRGNGINALTRLIQEALEQKNGKILNFFRNKNILILTEENINTLARIMQGSYNIIQPKQIIITRHYELKHFIASHSDEIFLEDLKKTVADYSLINSETGKINIWNFMSYTVSFMISKGIPSNTIILLLMLPVIVTLIAIFKQVVGITTFGVYTPSIITLSFLALGLKFGLLIFFIIIFTGAILRKLLNRFHLLHIPRVAIILSLSSLIILMILGLGTYLGISSIATVAVFPMLIMTTLAERFVTALGGKGFYSALLLMLETLFMSLVCYWVVEWHYLQNLILGHPEIIFLLIVFNYGLGRWSGLRLMEYIRFREVMKHSEE